MVPASCVDTDGMGGMSAARRTLLPAALALAVGPTARAGATPSWRGTG